jgi:hypothetical protein
MSGTEIIEGWITYYQHNHGWFKGYFRLYNGGTLQRFDHPKNPACRFQMDLKDIYDSMYIGSFTLKVAGTCLFVLQFLEFRSFEIQNLCSRYLA